MITRGFGLNSRLITRGMGFRILREIWKSIVSFNMFIKQLWSKDNQL